MAGKGDNRRPEDFKKIQNNWDIIEWRRRGDYCFECGKSFKKDEPRNYYNDGHAYCRECNFN